MLRILMISPLFFFSRFYYTFIWIRTNVEWMLHANVLCENVWWGNGKQNKKHIFIYTQNSKLNLCTHLRGIVYICNYRKEIKRMLRFVLILFSVCMRSNLMWNWCYFTKDPTYQCAKLFGTPENYASIIFLLWNRIEMKN